VTTGKSMPLTLIWFSAAGLSLADLADVDTSELSSVETGRRFHVLNRWAKAFDGVEQGCIVCSGMIRAPGELGGVIVAERRDADGQGGFSTSQPVCDMCAVDPERALEFARSGMNEAAAKVCRLTGR
jgi:hypothetical protein